MNTKVENKVEITNNLGKKVMVSKEFADAYNEAKRASEERLSSSDSFEEIPIEEFENEDKETNIKKGFEQWL